MDRAWQNRYFKSKFSVFYMADGRSQWPRGLRRGCVAARLLRLWVWIPLGAWMFVSCECCACCRVEVSVTSWSFVQRSPTDWRVVVRDLETSWMRGHGPLGGGLSCQKQTKQGRWAKSALSSEHDCDMISNDATFSLSEDWNGLKVIGYWHTVFFPCHVMGSETVLPLLHLYCDMFDLCIYFSVWDIFV